MGWHVITAGPSAGKTSVIRELSARGRATAPEGARIVIDQAVSEGRDVDELRSRQEYQDLVVDADLRIESNISDDADEVFLDRSLGDNIAYGNLFDRDLPPDIISKCRDRYDTVFLLEQIDYDADYARTEDASQAVQIHEELRDVYENLGYNVIEVDLMPVDRRVDYIEHCVRQGPPAIH